MLFEGRQDAIQERPALTAGDIMKENLVVGHATHKQPDI